MWLDNLLPGKRDVERVDFRNDVTRVAEMKPPQGISQILNA
jgi:hypothetical protein